MNMIVRGGKNGLDRMTKTLLYHLISHQRLEKRSKYQLSGIQRKRNCATMREALSI